jgi:hypothetical protein
LRKDDSPVEWVKTLAQSYRGAIFRKFRSPSYFMSRGDVSKHGSYGLLLKAAEQISTYQIAPAAWCLFSIDVWAETVVQLKSPPTVAFVFSEMRLEQRVFWFEAERDNYAGGEIKYGPNHLKLASDWMTMKQELLRLRPQTREELTKVVDRYFPGDSYDRRLANAAAEARRIQAQIDRSVAEGEVLWG